MAMAAHERKQAAIAGSRRIELFPAGQEVMIDSADDVEAIGHDARMVEMLAY
jgi:hypothetical protein